MTGDSIFDQSLSCLSWHRHPRQGDAASIDVFNRLLAKNIRPSGWTPNTHLNIERHQVSSRREEWTTEALSKLPRGHSDPGGGDFDCPIIVAEYDGTQRLLDGNHRINRWIETKDVRLHAVNTHTIAGVGQFVELPSAKVGA